MRRYVLAITGLMAGLCFLLAIGTATVSANTFTVNTTDDTDDGKCNVAHCSLREAINAANFNSGSDTIEFNIPNTDSGYQVGVTGTWTISLTSALPNLTDDETTIDGSSQAVYNGDTNPDGPEIEITGASMASGSCLNITSDNNRIRSLVINRCPWHGIQISYVGDANTISGNYIGTDAAGSSDLGNSFNGVRVLEGAQHTVIGGTTSGERNVISGNEENGVWIHGSDTMSNTISGNYIGTDASGSGDLGNSHDGVLIYRASHNVIGGDRFAERNVISGNDDNGVHVQESEATSNTISGNYIGTDASGSLDLGNSDFGVIIAFGAHNNTIGGDTSGERNTISGNDGSGVEIHGSGTMNNTISGNYIGTDAAGSSDLGNDGYGVHFWGGAQNNVTGGDTVGERNVIAFNDLAGVRVDGATTTGNTITENSIHSNAGLGIDLLSGGNTELTAPTIALADCSSLYWGTAPNNATVELFTGPDEEGKTYLTTVTADGGGDWSFWDSFTLDTYVTATATDGAGNTSEFSTQVSPATCNQVFAPLVMKRY